jgi:hypothetical protein
VIDGGGNPDCATGVDDPTGGQPAHTGGVKEMADKKTASKSSKSDDSKSKSGAAKSGAMKDKK